MVLVRVGEDSFALNSLCLAHDRRVAPVQDTLCAERGKSRERNNDSASSLSVPCDSASRGTERERKEGEVGALEVTSRKLSGVAQQLSRRVGLSGCLAGLFFGRGRGFTLRQEKAEAERVMPPKRPRKNNLPVPLQEGIILKDTEKKEWRLGRMIAQGGFGLIYLASPRLDIPVEESAEHVIKVEYLENGPLFSELKFYQRAAKQECIKSWMKQKCLAFLGIPVFWGAGQAEHNGKSYRFMVMERLGEDLQATFERKGRRFDKGTVLQIGVRMLDILEYIHENEYVHGDIKAANLLFGYRNPHEASPFALVLSAALVYFARLHQQCDIGDLKLLDSLWANKNSVGTLDLPHMHENSWIDLPVSQCHRSLWESSVPGG
ncbi:UNVERIFIED_CONTAM: hypothetical protein K2H54_038076 [Gekko kuhli]